MSISTANEKVIWDFLIDHFKNPYGVAGLMRNLNAESGLKSNNLQNSYARKLGYSDDEYTAAVDNGSYTNFVKDAAGYGLAQWTYWSRKQALYEFAKEKQKSIGDLGMQLEFLVKELASYKTVYKCLQTATSVREASDMVMTRYERPANQSESNKEKRASLGQKYFDLYAGEKIQEGTEKDEPEKSMSAEMKRALVADAYKTIIGRNFYNKARRDYCFKKYANGKYYSDCSSSISYSYKEAGFSFGILNTVGMY